MAEKNVKINVKTSAGYDSLYPKTKGSIVDFDNADTTLTSSNLEDAIKELDNNIIKKTIQSTDEIFATTEPGYYPDVLSIKGLFTQGEWTPTLFAYAGTTDPTVTYIAQNGKYFRIGNLVYVYFSITGNITQLGNGNAGIKGLPEEIIPLNGIPITLGRCFFLVGTDPTVSFTANIDGSTGEIQIRNAGGRTRQNFVLSTGEAFNILGTAVYLIKY